MIGLAIGVVAFLVASTGYVGGDLIYAIDVAENWYWIVLMIASIFALIVFAAMTGMGAVMGVDVAGKVGGFTGMAAGGMLGAISAFAMLAKTICILVIMNWLMGSIDPHAVNYDALTTKHVVGLVAILVLALLPRIRGSASTSSSK